MAIFIILSMASSPSLLTIVPHEESNYSMIVDEIELKAA